MKFILLYHIILNHLLYIFIIIIYIFSKIFNIIYDTLKAVALYFISFLIFLIYYFLTFFTLTFFKLLYLYFL